jgi:hypothetical protein
MAHDTDAFVGPCPPVTLPQDATFPVLIDVPIRGLLLRDAEDLKRLNRSLAEIRGIPQFEKGGREPPDPIVDAAMATYWWLEERVQAGEFAAYPGQYIAAAEKQVRGIGPDCESAVEQAMKADPSLDFVQIIVIHVPDPSAVGPLIC